jgi:hypothetical protein
MIEDMAIGKLYQGMLDMVLGVLNMGYIAKAKASANAK